jgi:hypothetical protein
LSRLFARGRAAESIATRISLHARADTVWKHLAFYEDIPTRPALLLRTLLPHPLKTNGNKMKPGAVVQCLYADGNLAKRITIVEPCRFLGFEVVEQRLGIEDCIRTVAGSYEIVARDQRTDVVLMTKYEAYLRPRLLWRPFEALLVSQLHQHVLSGLHAAVRSGTPATVAVDYVAATSAAEDRWTTSQSAFHR